MKLYHNISILLIVILAISCQKKESSLVVVDQEMKVHFDMFENEALLRGVTIDLETLQVNGYIVQINEDKVIGQSIKQGQKITVKVDPAYWKNANYMEQELLIFHELGHAILERRHQDATIRFNQCISIMRSSSSVCKCKYNEDTRKKYINELFN